MESSAQAIEAHNEAREALRKIALENAFSADRVRYAYIYQVRLDQKVTPLYDRTHFLLSIFRNARPILWMHSPEISAKPSSVWSSSGDETRLT